MHFYLSQLYADHYNVLRLLSLLSSETKLYQAGDHDQVRLDLVLDIFDYIQVYPEYWHHPIENAAFELLLVKQVPNTDQIWELKSEHKKLEALTRNAHQLFINIANDVVVSALDLVESCQEFITRQREHIAKENKVIYPLLEDYISFQEWNRLGDSIQETKNFLPTRKFSWANTGSSLGRNLNESVFNEFQINLRTILRYEGTGSSMPAAKGKAKAQVQQVS